MRAPSVVIATNAWAAALRPLRNKLFVISSDMIATEPIADRLDDIGWTQGEAISDSLTSSVTTEPPPRVASRSAKAGWIHRLRRTHASGDASRRHSCLDGRPRLPSLLPHAAYGKDHPRLGRAHRPNPNSLPIFGRLYRDANIHYGVGWSGNGVGPSVVGGKILASLALSRNDEWSHCGLVTAAARSFPPEPIRFVGAHIVREAIIRKEDAEALEKRPPRLAVALSKLAPTGLEDT